MPQKQPALFLVGACPRATIIGIAPLVVSSDTMGRQLIGRGISPYPLLLGRTRGRTGSQLAQIGHLLQAFQGVNYNHVGFGWFAELNSFLQRGSVQGRVVAGIGSEQRQVTVLRIRSRNAFFARFD